LVVGIKRGGKVEAWWWKAMGRVTHISCSPCVQSLSRKKEKERGATETVLARKEGRDGGLGHAGAGSRKG
jgi:hypothetical protein